MCVEECDACEPRQEDDRQEGLRNDVSLWGQQDPDDAQHGGRDERTDRDPHRAPQERRHPVVAIFGRYGLPQIRIRCRHEIPSLL